MLSTEFHNLKLRLNDVSSRLPPPTTQRSALTARQEEDIRFFAITAHAICEEYMEKSCSSAVDAAYNNYVNYGFCGRIVQHLCVMPFIKVPKDRRELSKMSKVIGGRGFSVYPTKKFLSANSVQISDLIKVGFNRYRNLVHSNHGIGLKYQFSLMSVLGFDLSDLSPTFTTRIIQLAELRGEVAHNGVVAARSIPEPSDLAIWSTDLIAGYREIDKGLVRLVKRKR